jgi:hypothetical protein
MHHRNASGNWYWLKDWLPVYRLNCQYLNINAKLMRAKTEKYKLKFEDELSRIRAQAVDMGIHDDLLECLSKAKIK